MATNDKFTYSSEPTISNVTDKTNSAKHDGYKYLIVIEFEDNFCNWDADEVSDEELTAAMSSEEYAQAQETYEDWVLVMSGWKRDEVYLEWKGESELWISSNQPMKTKKQEVIEVENEDVDDDDEEVTMNAEELTAKHGVKVYEIDGLHGVDKHSVRKLVGCSHDQQIFTRVRAGQLTVIGKLPMAPDSEQSFNVFDLNEVLDWADEFKPKKHDGTTRYQLSIADADMAKVAAYMAAEKIHVEIVNLTKLSRAAAKKHNAKKKADKKATKSK